MNYYQFVKKDTAPWNDSAYRRSLSLSDYDGETLGDFSGILYGSHHKLYWRNKILPFFVCV